MADIKIYGVLVNDTSEGIVTRSDQVFDKNFGKTQASINEELMDIANSVKDLTITYDDFVTETSKNAVKSSGVFKAIKDVSDHLPFIGSDGYVYVWDPALNDYKRSDTNLTGPAGETGGGIHLIFDAVVLTVDEFGVMSPSSPLRVRAIRQYGQTGLDEFTEGRIRWWYNDIEDESKPDGESPVDEDGNGVSEVFIDIDPDHHEKVTVRLYLDQAATKLYDQQDVVILRHPTIYKLDLTNENSMVPMEDDEGNVKDEFLETTQAILYYGASQIPFNEIKYSIGENDHDGITTATINEEGIVTLKGWKTAWSNVSIKITAEYKGHIFYATYTIARVSGVAIYRLKPSVTGIKKKKDGTFNTDKLYVNVMKVVGSNTGSMTEKVLDLAAEKLSVRYTYNNKVNSNSDIYTIDDIVNEGIPIKDEELPETLDGSLVSEVDIYLVKSGQALEDLDIFIDHETVPLVEDGDDGFNLMLTNENMTIAALADGTQVGQLMNTQGLLYKGIQNLSEKAKWTYKILSGSIKGAPRWHATIPGYLNLAGCEVDKNSDEVEIAVYAQYPSGTGETFQKTCTITKAKQGATGEAGYKSIIFCRTNTVPDTPLNGTTGGTYEKPVPTHDVTSNGESLGIKWYDGIPDGKEKIWSSSRYFSTYSIEGQKATTWTVPTVMSDTENMNIEFTWYDPYIGDPDSDPDFWFDPDKDAEVFQTHTMIYMATQRLENGVPVTHSNADGNETSWTIVRVLGEKGETALRSFVFTRCFDKPATPVGGTIENPIPDPEQGDGTVWYDGIPGGDPLLPVWGSLRTFSSIKHLETEWSEPQIMKDVPNEYDVQYSIKRERPDPPSDDYPSSGADWFDPEDPTATPEIMAQVMWMAQRWYSSDGWSPWDIIKVKGEDGKDGSKAIPRMRGDWKDDITYDSWILSGESHIQVDEESGETVEVLEAYQDLVYYKNNEVQECYKCLKSHKKNDAYNPGTATYSWDQKKQADISSDGVWMKAVNYEFLSTRLLNAEQIIADVVAARKTEIFGQAPGKWKGTDNNVYTRVVTESGKIEFEYKLNDDGSEGGWTPLITFGYDPNVGGGVLKFYRDGKALYDLGPTGLSASEVNSPYYETKPYYESAYSSDSYLCYGVYFCDAENEEIYDSASGTIKDFYLNKKAGREYYIKSATRKTWRDEKEFTYKNLKTGSFIPQMTLPFDVISPIPIYDPVTDTTVTGAEVTFEGDPVGYPSNSNPVITFGQKTIGFMALRHPDVKYHSIDFSWATANLDRSLGVLTYPLRKWTCVSEKLTSLSEINIIQDNGGISYEIGKTFNPYCSGGSHFPFTARIDSVDDSMGTRYLCHLLLADGSDGTTAKTASNLFKAFINEGYNTSFVNTILESGYVKLEQVGADSPLLSSTVCVNIIKEAIDIVGRTISNLVNQTASGLNGFNIILEPNSSNGHTLNKGLHWSFYNAVQGSGGGSGAAGLNATTYRTSFYLAKNILNNMLEGGYDITNKYVVGYIFPEDQYFTYEDEDDFISSNNRLKIVKLGSDESIFEKQPFSGYTDCYIPKGKNPSHFGTYSKMPIEDKEKHRAYLMIDAASGTMGNVSNSSTGTGNTYEVSVEIDYTDDDLTEAVMTIKYKAVPKISAYLDKGMNYMIWSSGYSSWSWTNNYYINDVLDSTM